MARMKPSREPVVDTTGSLHTTHSRERLPASSIAAMAGIVAPILFWLIVTIAGSLRHDYNPVAQYISVLEQGHYGWLQNTNLIISGSLFTVFAFGLHHSINGGRSSKIGSVLLISCGLGSVFIGLTPMVIELITSHLHNRQLTFTIIYWTHLPLVTLAAVSLLAASFPLARGMRTDPCWQRYEVYSLGTSSAVLVILCFYIIVANVMLSPSLRLQERFMFLVKAECPGAGFVERLLLVIICVWIEALAIHLFSLPGIPRRGSPSVPRFLPCKDSSTIK